MQPKRTPADATDELARLERDASELEAVAALVDASLERLPQGFATGFLRDLPRELQHAAGTLRAVIAAQ